MCSRRHSLLDLIINVDEDFVEWFSWLTRTVSSVVLALYITYLISITILAHGYDIRHSVGSPHYPHKIFGKLLSNTVQSPFD